MKNAPGAAKSSQCRSPCFGMLFSLFFHFVEGRGSDGLWRIDGTAEPYSKDESFKG